VDLLFSNNTSIAYTFGVKRYQAMAHTSVDKAKLQLLEGNGPDHVTLDETVTQLNN